VVVTSGEPEQLNTAPNRSTSWVDLSATDSPTPFQKFVIQLRLVGFAELLVSPLGLVCLRQPILSRLEALQSWNRCPIAVSAIWDGELLLQQVDLANRALTNLETRL